MWFNALMRWIFISPHLDDAILSTGGLIHDLTRNGEEVEIWTLMCGFLQNEDISSFARALHSQWGFGSAEETIRSRRAEDQTAAETLGTRVVHFDFPDCIYRRSPNGTWLYDVNTFIAPRSEDQSLIMKITTTLAEHVKTGDQLVCPLAIGGHVDHVVVRQAVENLKRPLQYYADIPYLLYHPQGLAGVDENMNVKTWKTSWRGLFKWQNAAAAYVSQIPMEFETPWKMRRMITRYGWKGLRLWSMF